MDTQRQTIRQFRARPPQIEKKGQQFRMCVCVCMFLWPNEASKSLFQSHHHDDITNAIRKTDV